MNSGEEPTTAPSHISQRMVWLSLLLLLVVAIGWTHWLPRAHNYFDSTVGPYYPRTNYDFRVYYAAGHNWAHGLDPYRGHYGVPGALLNTHKRTWSGYIYPPTLLPFYAGLARLNFDIARTLWLALDVLALLGALAAATLLCPRRRPEVIVTALLLGVVSFPLLFHIKQGQVDMLVAGLATAGFALYGRRRSWPSALLLSLAVVAKVMPLLIVVAMVLYYRDLRYLAKNLVCLGGILLLSLVAVSPHLYVEFTRRIMFRSRGSDYYFNQSLARFVADYHLVAPLLAAAAFAVLLLGVFLIGRATAAERAPGAEVVATCPDMRVFALVVLVMLLFSPLSWVMAYVWLIVPLAVLVAGDEGLPPWARVALGAAALMTGLRIQHQAGISAAPMIGAVIAVAVLVICLLPLLRAGMHARGPA